MFQQKKSTPLPSLITKRKKNKRIGAEGKTKDINQRESLWIWTCWTKYQSNWMTQLKCVKVTAYCPLALKNILSAVSVLRQHALSQSLAAVSDCLVVHLVQRQPAWQAQKGEGKGGGRKGRGKGAPALRAYVFA